MKKNWTPAVGMRGFKSYDMSNSMDRRMRRALAKAFIDGMKTLADDLAERVPGSMTHEQSEKMIAMAQSRLRIFLSPTALRR